MFLLNLFTGKQEKQPKQAQYDKISFKINLKQNIPRYQQFSGPRSELCHPQQQKQFNPDHPLYHHIFPKKQDSYVEYLTKQNDTIFGISIKLDVSQNLIRKMNHISGNLYPNMKIKLPEGCDLSKLEDDHYDEQTQNKLRISQLLKPSQKSSEFTSQKFTVEYYAGLSGYIKGTLTINPNYLIFNPSLQEAQNNSPLTVQRLLKFNAIVQTVDIQDITQMEIPAMNDDNSQPQIISVIQFLLYRVGNTKIQKKYKEKLKQLKLDHKAIASVSFSVKGKDGKTSKTIANEILEKVKEILVKLDIDREKEDEKKDERSRLTSIPFFDIIHENIHQKQQEQKKQLTKVISQKTMLGSLSDQSDIITPTQFKNLVRSFPVLYQLYNWVKVYSSTRDGSSFITLLNKCRNVQPAILLIKQHKGYKFGSFLIEDLHTGKSGRGEMFIFSFGEEEKPKVYTWTGQNQTFVYIQKNMGIGIGMGFKYGIYIKNDLDKGSSSSTKTFGNPEKLSKKEDFFIDEVEIWGVDMSF